MPLPLHIVAFHPAFNSLCLHLAVGPFILSGCNKQLRANALPCQMSASNLTQHPLHLGSHPHCSEKQADTVHRNACSGRRLRPVGKGGQTEHQHIPAFAACSTEPSSHAAAAAPGSSEDQPCCCHWATAVVCITRCALCPSSALLAAAAMMMSCQSVQYQTVHLILSMTAPVCASGAILNMLVHCYIFRAWLRCIPESHLVC